MVQSWKHLKPQNFTKHKSHLKNFFSRTIKICRPLSLECQRHSFYALKENIWVFLKTANFGRSTNTAKKLLIGFHKTRTNDLNRLGDIRYIAKMTCCQSGTRTPITCSRGMCPTIRRTGNDLLLLLSIPKPWTLASQRGIREARCDGLRKYSHCAPYFLATIRRTGNNWKSRYCAISTISYFSSLLYPDLLFLKQSMHVRLLVSRGSNGSEVIAVPQPLQVQLPANFGRSPSCFFGTASPRFFPWHSRHRSPAVLFGSNGSSVIVVPQLLHVQFPWCMVI